MRISDWSSDVCSSDLASPQEAQDDGIWTVSQLNRRVGALLEGNFSRIWVRGEISNFTQAASGHWYFSVKDEGAAVRAVMFRGRAQAVGFVPKPGEKFEFRVNELGRASCRERVCQSV